MDAPFGSWSAALRGVEEEAFAALSSAFGCTRTGPTFYINAQVRAEKEHDNATVHKVCGVPGLLGQSGEIIFREHQQGIKLSAALKVSLAEGIRAAAKKIGLLQRFRTQR